MPIGDFLDVFPTPVFMSFHVLFLVIGAWSVVQLGRVGASYANALALYAISQLAFLASLAGIITLRLAVFTEQSLIVVMVLWIVWRVALASAASRSRAAS